jgi:type IV secretion system protein VirB1
MSASTDDDAREPIAQPVLSGSIADLTTPGVVVEVDAAEAESLGAFLETALTEADAWDANADLDLEGEEAADGN